MSVRTRNICQLFASSILIMLLVTILSRVIKLFMNYNLSCHCSVGILHRTHIRAPFCFRFVVLRSFFVRKVIKFLRNYEVVVTWC